MTNFDSHPSISTNPNLPRILSDLSLSHPPPLQSSSITGSSRRWSLDGFFILPFDRLQYYREMYDRLLRTTKEGKSDWRMLKRSCERLEVLVEGVEQRLGKDVNVAESRELAGPLGAGASRGGANPIGQGKRMSSASSGGSSIDHRM